MRTQNVLKPNLTKLMNASQQSKRSIEAKCSIMRPESTTFSEDNNSDGEIEDVVETIPEPSPGVQGFSHASFPSPEPLPQPLKSLAGLGLTKSISESLPWKYVGLLSGDAGQRGKITLNGQVEDSPEKYPNVKLAVLVKDSVPSKTVGMKDLQTSTSDLSAELDLEMTSEEEEEKPVGDENSHSQVEEEKKKHKSSEVEVSDNVCDTADESGLIQQGKSGGNSNQEFAAMENEAKQKIKCKSNYDSHGDPGMHRKEVKKKDNSKWTPEECVIAPIFEKTDSLTGGLLHVNDDSILSEVDQDDDRPAKIKSNENNKVKEQINYVDDLNNLTQSSETASKDGELLYYENSMLLIEQLDTRCTGKSFLDPIYVKFCYVIIELSFLKTSDSCEEAKDLLCKNYMTQDEIAMLRLEIDAVKIQHREKENKHFDNIEIVKGKNDDLQKAIKLNEETLAAASHDHDQCQTSERDLELAFQRARDEWLHLQDKMKTDVANLKDNNKMLSQQLSRAESKFNNLEIKLHHTRDSLRENILMLEHVQRDLSQTEFQKQEIEHTYQNEQGKVNKYIGKQESLEERLSRLQSENIPQQLDDAQNRADSKEKTVISIQDQFQQIVRKLQAEREKEALMLEERNKELIKECNHLKERMCQYENEKAGREIDDLTAELETTSSKCLHLDAKNQVLREELLSMKGMQKKCEKLEKNKKKLEQEVVNLRGHIEMNMIEDSQIQAASQENLEQLQEKGNASVGSQMELRIKDLESELSKIVTLDDSSEPKA
ncbi:hypothetical protein MG293_006751 [Ovis ammon polii]|uniref:CCDC144C-like coiled-coil domain-containing protein n=1 Tax=Ovis ammon polii TaxID=230172 RepID=A0AAD4YE46_OVIAM|nr:hypothetical protein MG293_006751 [Ovis ammon polii]